jgi:AbrB family looped-hinge helix DNA binding protein
METVTISSKYQMVIPKAIRKRWGIRPGQKVRLVLYNDRLEVIPIREIKEARGFLKGMDSEVEREREDRL